MPTNPFLRRGPLFGIVLAVLLLTGCTGFPERKPTKEAAPIKGKGDVEGVPANEREGKGPLPEPVAREKRPLRPCREAGPYRVGPKDILSVEVYGEGDLTGSFPVSPEGTVNLAWLGELPVVGLTVEELDRKLTELLKEKYIRNPTVQVRVTGFHSKKAYLFGRVSRPGVYDLKEESTLLDLLLQAQGPSKSAGDKVTVLRLPEGNEGEPEKITVSLFRLLVQGDASQNLPIRDGDIVTVAAMGKEGEAGVPVAETEDRVYIVGAVTQPGSFPWREDLTVLDVILSARGLEEFASGNKAKIIRGTGDAKQVIPLRIKDILGGDKEKNVLLQPGDHIVVPESFF